MADVPRNVQRQIDSSASVRGLEVKDVAVEEETSDGSVYRVIILDEDAEEGENPAFFVERPSGPMGRNMFSERLDKYMDAVRNQLRGIETEAERELQETEQRLQESGHPGASDEEVEYGPGPIPNVEGVQGGYDDGQVSVRSTTEANLPDPSDYAQPQEDHRTEEEPSEPTSSSTEMQDSTQNTTTQSTQTQDMQREDIIPDDFWGRIADTALDARQLDEKGHDKASAALLEEIQDDIEAYLDQEED